MDFGPCADSWWLMFDDETADIARSIVIFDALARKPIELRQPTHFFHGGVIVFVDIVARTINCSSCITFDRQERII
jgi:hypothetical protein